MKIIKKLCDKCNRLKPIWKNHNGMKFCKTCWSAHKNSQPIPKASRKKIPLRSPKKQKQDKEYSKLRRKFLTEHDMCLAHLPGCSQHSTEVHHRAGKIGDLYLDTSLWLPVCRNCHSIIELHPLLAKEKGFSISRL